MAAATDNLAWEDKTTLALRALYERYGYRQYRMGKFEPYDMYRENRNFLKTDTVITFTDATGRLMALKPDVTMSIVKNTQPDMVSQKLYYIENVFRMAAGTREYREISQIGIESIGGDDGYTQAEVVMLAMRSLETISGSYLLCLSHMGFISAVFAACGFTAEDALVVSDALRRRSVSDITALAARRALTEELVALLRTMAELSAPPEEALATLRALTLDTEMQQSLAEIELLCRTLSPVCNTAHLRLDFTLVNDMDYYTGIAFQGYIQGLPRAVLSGGRYDNLMRRFGKPQSALGFALYLGELSRMFGGSRAYDADVLVVYGDAAPDIVMRAAASFVTDGKSVRVERILPDNVRARHIYTLHSDGRMEVRLG
jgi:ATP phosphoribosyltransferase regulatory subunit